MNFRNDTIFATHIENFKDANSDKNKLFQIAHYTLQNKFLCSSFILKTINYLTKLFIKMHQILHQNMD